MQARITGDLRAELTRLAGAIRHSPSKNVTPFVSHVAMDFSGGQHGEVRLSVTDLEFSAQGRVDAEVEPGPDFSLCLRTQVLLAAVKSNPGSPTFNSLGVTSEASVVFQKGASYRIGGIDRQDMPAVPPVLEGECREAPVPAGPVAQAIKAARVASGGRFDVARMEASPEGLAWVSTDGRRLAWAKAPGVSLPEGYLSGVDWPASALAILPDFLDSYEVAQIGYCRPHPDALPTWLWAKAGDSTLWVKAPYQPFPGTWHRIVDIQGYSAMELDLEPLSRLLRQSALADDTMITLEATQAPPMLHLKSRTPHSAEIQFAAALDTMPIKTPLAKVHLNPRFLEAALQTMPDGTQSVLLRYGDPDQAVEIRPSGDAMPLQGTSIMPIKDNG